MRNTNDQKFYEVDGTLKAEIDVYYTHEAGKAPPLATCRHAVLQIQNGSAVPAYVVYDRLLGRIVNGVYYDLAFVLATARYYNEDETAPQDMTPNGAALGLHFPTHTQKRKKRHSMHRSSGESEQVLLQGGQAGGPDWQARRWYSRTPGRQGVRRDRHGSRSL